MLPAWGVCYVLSGCFLAQVLANSPNVCKTAACTLEAERVKKNMDISINPCDDFFGFACGSFVKNEKIDSDKTEASFYVKVDEILEKQFRGIIESPEKPDELRPFKMAKRLYNICLRQDLIEKRGVGFVVDMVNKAGRWPVLEGDKWDESKFNWVDTVYKLHDLGLGGELFGFGISEDLADSFKRVIEIDQTSFGLPREYMIKGRQDKFVQAYASYMTDIACLFGADNHTAVREFSDALDFEMELAKIALPKEERRDFSKLYNPTEIQELEAKYPIVNWHQYLRKMMNNVVELKSNEVIIVIVPSYFKKLQKLIDKTDKRTIANFIIWKAMSGTVHGLTRAMRDRALQFDKLITGRKEYPPRWKQCLGVAQSLSLATSALYIRNFFNEAAKENAADMVERIRLEMIKVLRKIDWMDEETRKKAIEKARVMEKHVAYPIELLEDDKLEKRYAKLEITGETYFESLLNLTHFAYDSHIRKLRKPVNKTDWKTHGSVAEVNAYYNFVENSMHLPAGILQNVFFSHDRPRYMNYGAIGSVIAHELTHGFDDEGSQFDKLGNLVSWWKPKTAEEFKKRMQCVIEQASNYTVKSVNMKLNGINTQGENVADSGGAKLSHRAYHSWAAEHGEEPRLVGLEEYNPRQMFWISLATAECCVYRKLALQLQITSGYHAPAEYRVNGAFSNQAAFSKDFHCPLGSKMNPVHKCNVW